MTHELLQHATSWASFSGTSGASFHLKATSLSLFNREGKKPCDSQQQVNPKANDILRRHWRLKSDKNSNLSRCDREKRLAGGDTIMFRIWRRRKRTRAESDLGRAISAAAVSVSLI
jgi:hypothetical protein